MSDILKKVDVEKLYQHILEIEGVKHHIVNPQKLNETADYIRSKFQEYGLNTNEQTFEVKGSEMIFKNIEGYIGDESKPEILVTGHYDTSHSTPWANDNGSGIAVMLEVARLLASENLSGCVRFISFTLEELHPTLAQQDRNKGLELGIFDEDYRYMSYHSHKMFKKFNSNVTIGLSKGKPLLDTWQKAYEDIKDNFTDSEKEYCEYIIESRSHVNRTSSVGELGIVGSDIWVKKALELDKQITGVINLAAIGYTSKRKHSQFFPPLLKPLFFPTYKVKFRKGRGDFISIVSDKNSKRLGKIFIKNCKHKNIKLPFLWIKIPLRFEKISKWLYDLIKSDHAPFWKENIPAVMLTDTAYFRSPFHHTEADTIDKLDFDFMKKVTQAIIATVIELSRMDL